MILITGAAGHLGNVLARELLAKGKQVRGLVLPGENLAALEGLDIEIVEGDVLDMLSLQKAMQGVEMVFHMAGIISIMPGRNDMMRRVNVDGTKNVIRAAQEAGVRRLVYTSSIHALSRDCKGKIDECIPFDPHNPAGEYDRTKAEASLAVLNAVKDGLDAVVVCPTGVIGPYDYRDSEMGTLLRDWLRKKPHVLIEGEFDFVDVRDVAAGAISCSEKGRIGEGYILTNRYVSVPEMLDLFHKFTGKMRTRIYVPMWLASAIVPLCELYYKIKQQPPIFNSYSLHTLSVNSDYSHEKASRELGYTVRPFKETIRDTIEWLKSEGRI